MSLIFATIPPKRLAQGITSASSSFYINNIIGFDTVDSLDVTSADLGTQHYCVFRNDTGSKIEIMEIDPTTISTGPITIVRRGLSYYGDRTTQTTVNKLDWSANETIVQLGTDAPQIFQYLKEYIDSASIAGAVPASTSAAGIVVEGTQAQVDAKTATTTISTVVYKNFASLDKIRATKYHDYAADSVGTDAYAITITPAITAYSAGQEFTFKAGTANTGACTLNVSGLGAKTIKKSVSTDLETGDILLNQIVTVIYDGTNMQLKSPIASPIIPIVKTYLNAASPATWTKPSGLKYVVVEVQAAGGNGGNAASGGGGGANTGGGGGGGGYSKKQIATATLGATETITIGAVGVTSSYGSHASATSGSTGSSASGATSYAEGGAGSSGSSGDVNGGGGAGTFSIAGRLGGTGGCSFYGGGGKGGVSTDGSSGAGYGGGGGGAQSNAGAGASSGGAGAPAIVIVTEYY